MSRGTIAYILQRALLIAFAAVAVSSIVFLGVHQLPGSAFVNERNPNPAAQAALLHHYHLDLPLPDQYWLWIKGIARGDLGESLVNRGEAISPLITREAGVSATLGIFALIVTVGVGLILGSVAALMQNTWVDHVAVSTAIFAYSVPNFIWATLLVLLTVTGLYHLTGGAIYEDIGWGKIEQVPVPALCLGLPYAGFVARLTRASLLEVIRQDYIRTAYAKGVRVNLVVIRHALPNALIPVVTILGPLVTGILTGSVVIENIFGIPGLGKEFVTSIVTRDYNIVIAVFTFYAILIGLANLIVDLVYPILDPRIRY